MALYNEQYRRCYEKEKELWTLCEKELASFDVHYEVGCGTVYVSISFMSSETTDFVGKSRSCKEIAIDDAIAYIKAQ